MKREIRFRAWDIEAKRMYWFDLLWGNHNNGNGYIGMAPFGEPQSKHLHRDNMWLVDPMECEIMQFTGLLDKNGKEIYEGDIMQHTNPLDNPFVVCWIEESACFDFNGGDTGFLISDKSFEVIGNVYENPELLNQEL